MYVIYYYVSLRYVFPGYINVLPYTVDHQLKTFIILHTRLQVYNN